MSEQKPVAWLKFWAAQYSMGDGNIGVDDGLEVCNEGEIGMDGEPAFPVYAKPISQSPAPIPEHVAQASGIEVLTITEHTGLGELANRIIAAKEEPIAISIQAAVAIRKLLATQLSQEVTQQAAKAETAEHAVSMLSGALNHARDALRFYAEQQHFHMHQPDEWDTVSGEPQNFYEDSNHTATVEDGSVAKQALENVAGVEAYSSLAPTTSTVSASTVEYVPIAVNSHDEAGGSHPNDRTPADSECQKALDARGDDSDQGLDPYWKWGFRAGWHDHKRIAALSSTVSASGALAARDDVRTDAARDVLAERRRQVEQEGWAPAHDDKHGDGQMAVAAGYYALACGYPGERDIGRGNVPNYWPWAPSWWKPRGARRNLVKAGALILAEIERIDRAAQAATDKSED